ncbi:MAG TPA: ATP-binding protein [Crinalium sp.]|jgi:PAS domain S-box-containing protein
MDDLLSSLFSSGPFIPHGHCYLWKPNLVWLHGASDAVIALAYYSIPVTLFYFVNKRKDLPFHGIFLLFAAFIVACGTTHLMEIWTLWHPTYWVSGGIKAATAAVSLFTALELVPLVPQALALPSPAQLEQANQELQAQINERLRIEEELRQYQNQLEQRVQERTAELVNANEQLQQEIRDRQQTEEALRQSVERWSLALTASHMGDWRWDAETDVVTFSERAAEIFGIPPGPHMTWNEMRELLHPDDRDRARVAVEQAIANHSDYDIEYRILHTNGSMYWVAVKGRAEYDESGTVLGMMGVVQDISDRKQIEAEIATLNRNLQNRVNELQTLFDVIPIGILIAEDLEFKQVRANPAFAQVLGISVGGNASATPPAPNPRPPYRIFQDGRELAPEESPLRSAALKGVPIERTEVEIWRNDGAVFNLFGYAAPLFDEQGKPRGAVGAFLDITERKQAEAEREQLLEREQIARAAAVREAARSADANRIKDEFLAVLSHELRTPLNPILGWTRLLRMGRLDAEKTAMALETIERNAKLQTQLIEDLLDISRILQGKLTLTVTSVDLLATIEAAKETVRLAAEAKSIQITTHLTPTPSPLMGDPNRLQQVVWNLLSNAVKFTPAEGQIDITLQTVGNDAQIIVRDTGKGISPDFLPYVFDTFRQADGTTTRNFGGLGLGLAIVRQIVELHGGYVEAESPGDNRGATFTVHLPLMQNRAAIARDSSKLSIQPLSLQDARILIVDDDVDTLELLAFILEEHGANTITANSCSEAIVAFKHSPPDIVISDIGMPNLDGYALIRQIRSIAPSRGGAVPAIALTAYASESDHQQILAAGFQKHLTKPIEPDVLLGAIAELLQRW